jgi:hypothetical protein
MVNFIIRDGDKFVLNGNELMRTENPVLEVPDIVGSEEVTEKIAEDVQVGDLLYNVVPRFDLKKMLPGQDGYTCKFIVVDGDLHCIFFQFTGELFLDYIYKDGTWQLHRSKPQEHISNIMLEPFQYGGNALTTSDGRVLISLTNSTYAPWFSVGEYHINTNGAYELFQNPDASAWPDVQNYNTNQWRYAYSTDMYEASGTVHLAVGLYAETSSQGVATYTLDLENKRINPVTIDASSDYLSESVRMMEYDNQLYLAVAGNRATVGHLQLYRYNASTNHWDFVSYGQDTGSNLRGLSTLVTSSGDFFIAGSRGTAYYLALWKYNDATEQFEEYVDFDSYDPSARPDTYGRNTSLFEYNGSAHVILIGDQGSDDLAGHRFAVYRHNSATSSFDYLPSGINGLRLFGGSNGVYGIDTINFNNEAHCAIQAIGPEFQSLMKWDPAVNRFERNFKLDSPVSLGTVHDIELVEFSGTAFVGVGTYRTPRLSFSEFITSGDSSGYFLPMLGPDVGPANEVYGVGFYELSGVLRMVGSGRGPYFYHYEYDPADHRFKKLADPSGVPTTRSYGVATAQLSGVQYIAMGHETSPYMKTWYVDTDGSSLINLPDPSSLPAGNVYDGIKLIEHNGELLLAVAGVANDVSWSAYKLNGGVWEDIPVNYNYWQSLALLNGKNSLAFFKIGDDLYLLDDNDGYPNHHIFKYDGSAWNEDLDELPNARYGNSNIQHAEHNGENYFLVGEASFSPRGGRVGVIKRSANGDWLKIPIEHYGDYYIRDAAIFSVNGTLMVLASDGLQSDKIRRYDLSEFVNEKVWVTDYDPLHDTVQPFATGIALESGSKGDTIKIRKVKR